MYSSIIIIGIIIMILIWFLECHMKCGDSTHFIKSESCVSRVESESNCDGPESEQDQVASPSPYVCG